MKKLLVFISLTAMLTSYACTTQGTSATPSPSSSSAPNTTNPSSAPTDDKFASVKAIINQSCVSCHNTANPKDGYSFSTDAEIIKAKNMIKREISGKKMPPKNETPLTAEQLETIASW